MTETESSYEAQDAIPFCICEKWPSDEELEACCCDRCGKPLLD